MHQINISCVKSRAFVHQVACVKSNPVCELSLFAGVYNGLYFPVMKTAVSSSGT